MKRRNGFWKTAVVLLSLTCLVGCASAKQPVKEAPASTAAAAASTVAASKASESSATDTGAAAAASAATAASESAAAASSAASAATAVSASVSAAASASSDVSASVSAAASTSADASTSAVASSSDTASGKQADWTLLLYLCGSTLEDCPEHCATTLIERLSKVPASDKVNFVVETGGSKSWANPKVSPDKIQRFQISGADMELRDEQPLSSMSDPDTLSSFLKWGTENYPAKHTIAVLMDHGGSTMGAEMDEIFDDSIMSVPEIVQAFKDSGSHFDIIGFDACLMANYEIAADLSPYADYLLASEETECLGWDYTQFGQAMVDNPEISPEILGRNICDGYVALREKNDAAYGSTLSITDLSKVQPIVDAVSEMGKAMGSCIPDPKKLVALSSEIQSVKRYYYSTSLDLVDFARKVTVLDKSTTQKVVSAVQDAVVYKANADSFTGSNGLSIYYGLGRKNSEYSNYANVCPSPAYVAFLDAMNYSWRAPASLYEKTEKMAEPVYSDYHVDYTLVPDGNKVKALHVTKGLNSIISITYTLYRIDREEDRYYLVGTFPNLSPWKDNSTFIPYFDGEVVTVGGVPCYLDLIEEQSDYSLFETPVLLTCPIDDQGNTADIRGYLRLLWTPNAKKTAAAGTSSDKDAADTAKSTDKETADTAKSTDKNAADTAKSSDENTAKASSAEAAKADTQTRWTGASTDLHDGYFQILGFRNTDVTAGGMENLPSRQLTQLDDGYKITFEIPETTADGEYALGRASDSIIYSRSDTKVKMKKIDSGDYAVTYQIRDALGHDYDSEMLGVKISNGVMTAQ